MEPMVIALDVDGTLFDGESVAPVAIDEIRRAHADGHAIIIVTGRRWESLRTVVPAIVELCDRIVCEEGGVLVNVASGELTLLAEALEPALLAELLRVEIPDLDVGHVVVGTEPSITIGKDCWEVPQTEAPQGFPDWSRP